MSKKLKVVVAYANIVDRQNEIFTEECLKKAAVNNVNKPITFNFTPNKCIGKVVNLKFKDGKLIADIELTYDSDLNIKDKVFRLAGLIEKMHKEKNNNIIDKIEFLGLGLINKTDDVY